MSLSNSARLLRGYMHATGITDAKVIASKLGISIRTIYRLKVDLAEFDVDASSATDGSAKTAICATGGTNDGAICAKSAIRGTEASATSATGGTPTCNQQKEIPPTPPKEKIPLPRTTVEIPTFEGDVLLPILAADAASSLTKAKSKASATDCDALTAFERYNDLAQRIGLPTARTLTPARRKSLRSRLSEHDGLVGWDDILANVERSAFLRGRNDRGWRADFDFLLQPKSCAKVRDGSYGNGAHGDGGGETQMQRIMRKFAEMDEGARA